MLRNRIVAAVKTGKGTVVGWMEGSSRVNRLAGVVTDHLVCVFTCVFPRGEGSW